MGKFFEYLINNIIYEINIIISTLKLSEFHTSSDQNYHIWKLVFCYLHLASAFLSISSFSINIYFKCLTLLTYVLVVIFDNLERSKIGNIKSFDFEIIKQFYYEFIIILNIIIIYDIYKVIKEKCTDKKNEIKELDNNFLIEDNETGFSNEINEDKKFELHPIKKNGKYNKIENMYLNKIKLNEQLLSTEKEKYNNLLREKEEESRQLIQLNSQNLGLLNENERLKQKEKEYLNRINGNENLLLTEKKKYVKLLREKEEEVKTLNQEIYEKEEKIKKLLLNEKEKLKQIDEYLEKIKENETILNNEKENYNNSLMKKEEELNKVISQKEGKINELLNENKKLKKNDDEILNINKENEILLTEKEKNSKLLKEKEEENEALKQAIIEKEKKINELGDENAKLIINKNEILNKNIENEKDNNVLKEKEEKLNRMITEKEKKINELLNEIGNLKGKETEYLNKIKENEKLLSKEIEKDNNLLKEKEEELNQVIIAKEKKIKDLLNENEKLKTNSNDYLNKSKEIEILLTAKEKNNNLLNKKEEENQALKQTISEKEKRINELEDENEKLKINEKEILNKNKESEKLLLTEKEKYNLLMKKEEELNQSISQKEEKINELMNENEKLKKNEKEYLKEKENLLSTKKEEYDNLLREKEEEIKKLNQTMFEKEEIIKKEIEKKLIEENKENENKLLSEIEKYKENEKIYYNILNKDPLLKYFSPTLIGLNNIGATCFMNSTLQCLSQTKKLTSYFLKENKKEEIINNNIALKNKDDLQLCPIYLDLIKNLWDINKTKSSFSPNDFMKSIEKMNPLFKQGQAGDSKDFIIFILERIHTELKKPVKQMSNEQNNIQPLNQYDRSNSYYHFCEDFMKDSSIISDNFYGVNETTNECLNCKNMYAMNNMNTPLCYNYGIFNNLIFPLEEVKNMKYNNQIQFNNLIQSNNQINFNTVTIYDCFCYNQKTELFTGTNQNYCNLCKQTSDTYYTNKIYSTPQILILILNRGKNNMYNVKLEFYETIDISQYVLTKNTPQVFNLYGVITHIGESGPNAHFVASCKSPIDNKWYRYNDAFVNPIGNVLNDIINFGTPYILFYQKIDNY